MKDKKLIISIVAVLLVIVISVLAVIGIRNNEPKIEDNSTSTTTSTTKTTTVESSTESTTDDSTTASITESITKETTTSKKEEKTTIKNTKPVTTTKKPETTTKVNITYPEVVYSNPFVDFVYGSYVRDIYVHTTLIDYSFGTYNAYDDSLEMTLTFRIDKIYLHIDETNEKIEISEVDLKEIPKYEGCHFYIGSVTTYDNMGKEISGFCDSVDIKGKTINDTFTISGKILHASEVARVQIISNYDENWEWIDW